MARIEYYNAFIGFCKVYIHGYSCAIACANIPVYLFVFKTRIWAHNFYIINFLEIIRNIQHGNNKTCIYDIHSYIFIVVRSFFPFIVKGRKIIKKLRRKNIYDTPFLKKFHTLRVEIEPTGRGRERLCNFVDYVTYSTPLCANSSIKNKLAFI